MAAAKKWRLVFRECGVGDSLTLYITTLRVFNEGAVDITSQVSSIAANYTWDSQTTIDKVLDSNTSTYWYVGGAGYATWAEITFPTAITLGGFSIAIGATATLAPYWTDVQYQDDFGGWVTVSTHRRASWSPNETKSFTIPAVTPPARYWGWYIPEVSSLGVGGLKMREVDGGADSMAAATITTSYTTSSVSALTDNDPSTIWTVSGRSTYSALIAVDLGSPAQITICEYTRGSSNSPPGVIGIMVSSDGADWAHLIRSENAGAFMPTSSTIVLYPMLPQTVSVDDEVSTSIIGPNGDVVLACAGMAPRYDYYRHGDGYISGVVTINGQPASREVLLFDLDFNSVIRSAVSDSATGAYDFRPLDRSRDYIVMSRDYQAIYNAVVADRVRPEPIQ